MFFVYVVNTYTRTTTKTNQQKSTQAKQQEWHRVALDTCTRTTTGNIYRTCSKSCHRYGALQLERGITLPTYFTILRGMNQIRMFPLY